MTVYYKSEPPGPDYLLGMRSYAVLHEVWRERKRQDIKWGEQNHPDRRPAGERPAIFTRDFAGCAEIARLQVDHEAKIGESNWTTILLEEVFEALAETDPDRLRAELVQVAAVAVAWIEAVDRREAES